MLESKITLIALLSPAFFLAVAIASWFQSGIKPMLVKRMSILATVASILIATINCYSVIQNGLLQSDLIGLYDIGFSIRLDALSVIMLEMIALLGFIIVKFSINYLDGDPKQGAFIGRLSATIASVQLLVMSGNLGLLMLSWVLTSMSLHRLLVFYSDRPGAQVAAKKKFILARLGDVCLLMAFTLLYYQFGSGNLEVIFNAIKASSLESAFWVIESATLFLALAAILKSAQFPTHGWLIEVMETPTPVSALLHAGLLNAGPFLIVRMAFVMDSSTLAPVLLTFIGGVTALFASVSYLTQTSVKTALGYSSVAHMGFSLMVCGLGVYSAAMLHLVAHSFYKAHAFLSSGSVIDLVKGSKVMNTVKSVTPLKITLGIMMALVFYTGFALIWGVDPKYDLPLLFIGAVIVLGLSRIFTAAIASKWNPSLILQSSILALLVTASFFTLESGTHFILSSQIPDMSIPGLGKVFVAGTLLFLFSSAVFIQILAPQLSQHTYYQSLAIHVRNGFYANAFFDRMIGALDVHSFKNEQTNCRIEANDVQPQKSELMTLKEQLT